MNKTSTVSPARVEILNSTLIRPNTLKYGRVKLSTSVMYDTMRYHLLKMAMAKTAKLWKMERRTVAMKRNAKIENNPKKFHRQYTTQSGEPPFYPNHSHAHDPQCSMLTTQLTKLNSGKDRSINQNNNNAILLPSFYLSIDHDTAPFPSTRVPLFLP